MVGVNYPPIWGIRRKKKVKAKVETQVKVKGEIEVQVGMHVNFIVLVEIFFRCLIFSK